MPAEKSLVSIPLATGVALSAAALAFVIYTVGSRKKQPAVILKYWNGRGLMEPARIMLSVAKIPFTDVRVGDDEDPNTAGDLSSNLGRLPVAVIDGVSIGQSAAINYAVASACGLMGTTAAEAAQIIAIAEHVKELVTSYRRLVPYGTDPSPAAIATFFEDTTASDVTGAADYAHEKLRFLLWHLSRIQQVVGSAGFAVGDRLSLADVLLFCALGDTLAADRAKGQLPRWKREPFGDAARTAAVLQRFPRIAACVASAEKAAAEWLRVRPAQEF